MAPSADRTNGLGTHRDIFVVGASAGGVETVSALVAGLPADFPGSIFIVIHIAPTATSVLPAILERRGPLRALHPRNGDRIEPGTIYVAPPDHHIVLDHDRIHLTRGPAENGSRPAVDVLFRSAAAAFGARVTGIIMSGNLDDGTSGLLAIKRCGGRAVVQDPDEALFPGMAISAIGNVEVDAVRPVTGISLLMRDSVSELVTDGPCRGSPDIEFEVDMSKFDPRRMSADSHPGTPSGFTCPDCKGALWELSDGEMIRYRCRVGHAFSPETLLALDSADVEEALWIAYRALEENAALARRMEQRARTRTQNVLADRFAVQAVELEGRAEVIRKVLVENRAEVPIDAPAGIGPE